MNRGSVRPLFACPYCQWHRYKTIASLNKHIGKKHKGKKLVRPRAVVPIY